MSSEDKKTLDELIEYLDNRGQFPLLSEELFMINITWNCSNKRLEKLDEENGRLKEENGRLTALFQECTVDGEVDNRLFNAYMQHEVGNILQLEAENKRLMAALEVYADDGNWIGSENMDEFEFAFGYKIAQEALKGE